VLASLTGVRALGVLAHDHEVGVGGDRAGHPVEGAHVDVQIELETQPQQEPPLEQAEGTSVEPIGGPTAPSMIASTRAALPAPPR